MAKCIFLLISCASIALIAALPLQADLEVPQFEGQQTVILNRQVRSPDGGSAGVDVNQDGASAHVNQNIYTSDDGRFKVDAAAQAHHDFHSHDNSYGGYVSGSFSW
ncbi:unnamed protein product [Ceratitis capitata]|uniref:(Mediterranean fruit fly) hypothetical protein n=1 Tax=Ceratitis capitata TaxID=7213 RepID=A0A811V3B2_CERCA|nr:unnamed protein product [Ceratitis capitata]